MALRIAIDRDLEGYLNELAGRLSHAPNAPGHTSPTKLVNRILRQYLGTPSMLAYPVDPHSIEEGMIITPPIPEKRRVEEVLGRKFYIEKFRNYPPGRNVLEEEDGGK